MNDSYAAEADRLLSSIDRFAADETAGYDDFCELIIDAIVPFLQKISADAKYAELSRRFTAITKEKE